MKGMRTVGLALVVLIAVADRSFAQQNTCSQLRTKVLDALAATETSDENAASDGLFKKKQSLLPGRIGFPPINWISSQIPDAECPVGGSGGIATLPSNCYRLFSGGVMCCGIVPNYVSICCTSSGYCAYSYF